MPPCCCRPAHAVIWFLSQSEEMMKIRREVETKVPDRLLEFQLSLGRGGTFAEDNRAERHP